MSCEEYKEMISVRLDGELSRDDDIILDNHLKSCSECRQFADELESFIQLNQSIEQSKMPTHTEREIIAKTINSNAKKKSLLNYLGGNYRIPRGLVWVGMLVIIVSAGNIFFRKSRTSLKTPQITIQPVRFEATVQKVKMSEADIVSSSAISRSKQDI
jgi:anti-sigma factor RsiW